jgi:hypothetical protein
VLIGCSSAGGTTTGKSGAPGTARAAGSVQCLRAEGARFPNSARDWRLAVRRAGRFSIVRAAQDTGAVVVVWQAADDRHTRRLYLLWSGRHDTTDMRRLRARAVRVVRRLAADPKHPSASTVLLGDGSAAQARRLDRVCLPR